MIEHVSNLNEQYPEQDKPLVVIEKGTNKRLLVVSFFDIDGTINNEEVPESARLSTIGPAKSATKIFERNGIMVGTNTTRAYGEARAYRDECGGNGLIICEDGAVIAINKSVFDISTRQMFEKKGYSLQEKQDTVGIIITRVTLPVIDEVLKAVESESEERLLTTRNLSASEINSIVHKQSNNIFARMSADRLASAYVINPSKKQRELLEKHADLKGIRLFGDLVHLLGKDAHKGTALEFINDNASIIFHHLNIDGILPIAFGNRANDIKFFEITNKLGGYSVLVQRPNGGYYVKDEDIPPMVIRAEGAFGYGIQSAIPIILRQLQERFF